MLWVHTIDYHNGKSPYSLPKRSKERKNRAMASRYNPYK